MWRKIMEWLAAWLNGGDSVKPPVPVPTPGPTDNATDLSGPLVDPEPEKYTPEYIRTHAEQEECGQERDEGLNVRFRVFIPSRNVWWILSSVGKGHVKRDNGGGFRCDDFTHNGYRYHIRGGRRNSDGNTKTSVEDMDVKGNRNLPTNIYAEVRKA